MIHLNSADLWSDDRGSLKTMPKKKQGYFYKVIIVSLLILFGSTPSCTSSNGPATPNMGASPQTDSTHAVDTQQPLVVSSPTEGVEPTPTSSSSKTPWPTEGEVDEWYLGERFFIFKSFESSWYVVDVESGVKRLFVLEDSRTPTQFYNWSDNGCSLIVGTKDGEIVRATIEGDLIEDVVDTRNMALPESLVRMIFSPDGSRLAYLAGYGEKQYDGYEFQDLYVINISNDFPAIQLTNHDRTTMAEWSPSGNQISFSGVDTTGVQQAFIYQVDGSEVLQVTHLADPSSNISGLAWSKDEEHLAVSHSSETMSSVEIYAIDDVSEKIAIDVDGHSLWWQTNTLVGIAGDINEHGQAYSGVVWFDIGYSSLIRRV